MQSLQQLRGRPLHFWLLIASGVALISLLLPWYSTQYYGSVSWHQTGFIYDNNTSSTWSLPTASLSGYGGGNGLSAFTFLLAAGIGGLGFAFRQGAWPAWARYALAAIVGLVAFVGIVNFLADPHLGPLLFAAAGGCAAPAALQVWRMAKEPPHSGADGETGDSM